MKKALIIVFIMCLLGMIFLSGSIGIFYEPVEVSLVSILFVVLFFLIIAYNLYKNKRRYLGECQRHSLLCYNG